MYVYICIYIYIDRVNPSELTWREALVRHFRSACRSRRRLRVISTFSWPSVAIYIYTYIHVYMLKYTCTTIYIYTYISIDRESFV